MKLFSVPPLLRVPLYAEYGNGIGDFLIPDPQKELYRLLEFLVHSEFYCGPHAETRRARRTDEENR